MDVPFLNNTPQSGDSAEGGDFWNFGPQSNAYSDDVTLNELLALYQSANEVAPPFAPISEPEAYPAPQQPASPWGAEATAPFEAAPVAPWDAAGAMPYVPAETVQSIPWGQAEPSVPAPDPVVPVAPEPVFTMPEPVVPAAPEPVFTMPEPVVPAAPEPAFVMPEPVVPAVPEPAFVVPEPMVPAVPEPAFVMPEPMVPAVPEPAFVTPEPVAPAAVAPRPAVPVVAAPITSLERTIPAVEGLASPAERQEATTRITQIASELAEGVDAIQSQLETSYERLATAASRRAPVLEIIEITNALGEVKGQLGENSSLYQQALALRELADSYLELLKSL